MSEQAIENLNNSEVNKKRIFMKKAIKIVKMKTNEQDIQTINNVVEVPVIETKIPDRNIMIENMEGLQYLMTIENNSVDLVLTDPPYIISRETGMDIHYNNVKQNKENNIQFIKTQEEWNTYKAENNIPDDINKEKYMKYGTIYGTKYCVKTNYGEWDELFTLDMLDKFVGEYYKKLKKSGTMIIFFDLFKISYLKEMMEKHGFKQIRMIEWIKTNPQPLNSSLNYLTNCREIALLGVKSGKPTFNSKYDNGIYFHPLQGGKTRFHPTQKSCLLIKDLIQKHSNEGDTVLDTFLGSGTTAVACLDTKRKFKGCEVSKEYYDKMKDIFSVLFVSETPNPN